MWCKKKKKIRVKFEINSIRLFLLGPVHRQTTPRFMQLASWIGNWEWHLVGPLIRSIFQIPKSHRIRLSCQRLKANFLALSPPKHHCLEHKSYQAWDKDMSWFFLRKREMENKNLYGHPVLYGKIISPSIGIQWFLWLKIFKIKGRTIILKVSNLRLITLKGLTSNFYLK